MSSESQGRFGRGASSMVSAVFISKVLGLLFIIPLQNMIGGYAYGLYYLAYPLYTVMLTLSTAGFPLALSKSISDLSARGRHREATATFRIVGRAMLVFGLVSFFLMWFMGPLYLRLAVPQQQHALLHDALPAVRALALALLLLPLMSAMRGYLQGYLNLQPSGTSQVVEQIVRVIFILAGAFLAIQLGYGPRVTAAVATLGAVVGAIPAFIVLRHAVIKTRRAHLQKSRVAQMPRLPARSILWRLFLYSLPIAMGSLVLPLSQQVDAWTVPRELVASGLSVVAATVQYGIYSGEALKLIQLPLAFANAIGASVMPAITEAMARKDRKLGEDRLLLTLRMTAFITLPGALILSVLALPINLALFKSTAGTDAIALAGVMSIYSAIELVSTYILQGYDRFYTPVWHMGVGLLIKLGLNLTLIPLFGIDGAAIAGIVGYFVSSWLNMAAIRRATGLRVYFLRLTWRTFVASGAVGLLSYGILRLYEFMTTWLPAFHASRMLALGAVLVSLVLGVPVYIATALMLRAVDQEELLRMPMIGPLLIKLARA
ncbi:putative polysaccharide biosynthesis protein [Sulfoacidibacillus thermotolerans]|uniref:Uncharacterized protein n=1 Tax=Sulfoacidibacillus thermotolerans TaxID=1765684 RepID=A0A2U3D8C3_SULT2|nr:polysaccharide biosynthesis protein [Sulfoacidibacillus thermotolerans]PWI57533.1 hypothetical protein BM613_07845 [Sulfoacidibacillus thermotolerans]